MSTIRLCKIEFYRFFHSMEIVKYFVLIPMMLFSMCYINIFSMRNDISVSVVWSSMSSIYMYMIVSMNILIAIYVGREFQYKTINYEKIKGYGICKIAVTKTVTCGIILPFSYTLCMLVYLMILSNDFSKELVFRVLLLFIIYIHICTSSVLYVMICKNGVLGGILAFARFYLCEAIGQLVITHVGAKTIEQYMQKVQVFHQWYELINIDYPIKPSSVLGIIIMTLVEYGCLLLLLKSRDILAYVQKGRFVSKTC